MVILKIMENNLLRPFDILSKAKGKTVVVELKNKTTYKGELKAFDTHLNLVILGASEISGASDEKDLDMVIRGDAIVTIKHI